MIVEKENVIKNTSSCNFCDRGKIPERGMLRLVYPYELVFTFTREGNGIKASICEECLEELFFKIQMFKE